MRVALRRIATIQGGGTPTAHEENWGGSIPFVTPPDLRPVVGGVVESTTRSLTELGAARGSNVVPANSVIVSVRAPIGYVARTVHPVALNQGCRALTGLDETRAHYLTYALIAASDELAALGRGTTFQEISASQLATLEVPNPPPAKQRAIADYLDRETAQIDTLIEEQQRLIRTVSERVSALVDHVVTKGLANRIELRSSGVNWLPEIPSHWDIRPLWTLFERIKDTGHPNETMLSVFRDFGVVPKDSRPNLNSTAENRDIYQLIEPGWLVTNRMKAWQGSVGVSNHRGIVSGHYLCFRPRHDEDPSYLNWLFRSPSYIAAYRLLSRGVRPGQAEINNDDYRVLPVLLPPLEEQKEISAFLWNATEKLQRLKIEAEHFIKLAHERRTALIAAAVTGQISVGSAA